MKYDMSHYNVKSNLTKKNRSLVTSKIVFNIIMRHLKL